MLSLVAVLRFVVLACAAHAVVIYPGEIVIDHTHAAFGPDNVATFVNGTLAVAEPFDACGEIVKDYSGQIVLAISNPVDYETDPSCAFYSKVLALQKQGAKGVIVMGNKKQRLDTLIEMPWSDSVDEVSIHSVYITYESGDRILVLLKDPSIVYTAEISKVGDNTPQSIFRYIFFVSLAVIVLWGITNWYFTDTQIIRRVLKKREDQLKKLESHKFVGRKTLLKMEEGRQDVECTVCLEQIQGADVVKKLPCGHVFHSHCIDPWISQGNDSCPTCKQSILLGGSSEDVVEAIQREMDRQRLLANLWRLVWPAYGAFLVITAQM